MKKATELFLTYSYNGDGNYRTKEYGSRAFRNTVFEKFRRQNPQYVTITGEGNDAPRGGKVGHYLTVVFTEEFKKIASEFFAEKKRREEALEQERINFYAEIEKYAALIEPIEGEDRKETESRLSKAIGSKIDTTVFHKAVSAVRKRK